MTYYRAHICRLFNAMCILPVNWKNFQLMVREPFAYWWCAVYCECIRTHIIPSTCTLSADGAGCSENKMNHSISLTAINVFMTHQLVGIQHVLAITSLFYEAYLRSRYDNPSRLVGWENHLPVLIFRNCTWFTGFEASVSLNSILSLRFDTLWWHLMSWVPKSLTESSSLT